MHLLRRRGSGYNLPGYPLPSRSWPPRRAEPKKSGVWSAAHRGCRTWEGLVLSPPGPPGNINTTPCRVSPPNGAPMATSARHNTHLSSSQEVRAPNPYHKTSGYHSPHTYPSIPVLNLFKPQYPWEVKGAWVVSLVDRNPPPKFLISPPPHPPPPTPRLSPLGHDAYHCSHLGPGPPEVSRSFQIGRTHLGQ